LRTGCRTEYLELKGKKEEKAIENYIMERLIILVFTEYYWNYQFISPSLRPPPAAATGAAPITSRTGSNSLFN
jgi:hypothetical protein